MKNVLRIIFLYFFFAGLSFSFFSDITTVAAQNGQPPVLLSTFDVDATPPVGSQLTYDTMINSGDLSLRARGIILQGAGKPIVLCAIDWIGIANESQDVFKQALAEAAGTTPDRVAVHTIHQHDAPICDFSAEKLLKENNIPAGCFDGTFARQLIKNIQKSILQGIDNAQPVTEIGTGKANVYKVASNRRVNKKDGKIVSMRGSSCKDSLLRAMPEGVIDPEISLISFWNKDKPLAVLSFYATHPQSYYLTKIANPDFPGISRFFRQLAVPDALHIHFNGAGGNIAAGKYNDGSHETRLLLAQRMADGMERAWENTEKYTIDAAHVKWETEPLFLPLNPKVEEIENKMQEMSPRLLANNMGRLGWYKRRMGGKCIETACLAINNARMLFMPGELFVEYQLAAKDMAPNNFVAMAAYGDYGPFYIGTRQAYAEGGYEIESSPVTEDSEEIIMDNMRNLLANTQNNNCNTLLTYREQNGNCKKITTEKEWQKNRKRILEKFQEAAGKLPANKIHDIDLQYTDSLRQNNYIRYSINFLAAPSERVYAYLYKPLITKGESPAVLALHSTGAGGKRIIDDDTPKKDRGYAKELAEKGYVVIAPDYPGFGELRDYNFENDRYMSGTMKGIYNHISCVDLLQTLDYVNKDKIGAIGHSLGGHNAIFVAAFDPRIKVTVTSCGWTLMDYYNAGEKASKLYGGRLGPWAQDKYMPFIKTKYNLDSQQIPFDFDEIIAAIAPRAFLSVSPVNDLNFSVEGVRQGEANIQKVYEFLNASDKMKVLYPGCEHDFPKDMRQESYNFIDKILK
jgi:esterase/lipase